jgi:hypothetical protein
MDMYKADNQTQLVSMMRTASFMNTKTKKLLEDLESAHLFHAIGQKDRQEWGYAVSWMDAMAHCVGSSWSNTLIGSLNRLSEKVLAQSKSRYQDWHTVDFEIRPLILALAKKKTADLMSSKPLPDKFMYSVFADFLGVAMEAEYSDIVAPGFCTNMIFDCYLKGHFPCGWEGKFPAGRLIVY